MSGHSKNIKLLEKINNIDEDFSEDDQIIPDIEGNIKENNYDLIEHYDFEQKTKHRESD